MLCKPCLGVGTRRDGHDLGLCWQHRRAKCRLCGELSAGKPYCVKCEHDADIERWKAESRAPWLERERDFDDLQIRLRKERLADAKYHTHRAVEILFRGMVLTLEAIWGGIKTPDQIALADEPKKELKKAA